MLPGVNLAVPLRLHSGLLLILSSPHHQYTTSTTIPTTTTLQAVLTLLHIQPNGTSMQGEGRTVFPCGVAENSPNMQESGNLIVAQKV